MKCYVIGDVTIPGWGFRPLEQAYVEAAAQATSHDVVIKKQDGDTVVLEIKVDQVAPKPPRAGHVDVPKEHRKNYGA